MNWNTRSCVCYKLAAKRSRWLNGQPTDSCRNGWPRQPTIAIAFGVEWSCAMWQRSQAVLKLDVEPNAAATPETARAMARAVRHMFGADYGLAVAAFPTGGPEVPTTAAGHRMDMSGTLHVALASGDNVTHEEFSTRQPPSDYENPLREASTQHAPPDVAETAKCNDYRCKSEAARYGIDIESHSLAAAAVNQTPMAWDTNSRHIRAAMAAARDAGVGILCLPELCITGYGCEDMFFSAGVQATALDMLAGIGPRHKRPCGLLWPAGVLRGGSLQHSRRCVRRSPAGACGQAAPGR